jgi:hypothetical protein
MSVSGFLRLVSVVVLMLASACASTTSAGGAQTSPVGQDQTDTVLEGHLEVLIADSDGGSRTLYFLISNDGRVPLRFKVDPPNLTTGTRVRVRGLWDADGTFVVGEIEKAA